MDKFQLSHLATADLLALKADICAVLRDRNPRREAIRKQAALPAAKDHASGREELRRYNSSSLLSIPGKSRTAPHHIQRYMLPLIEQDWSNLYPRRSETGDFYVYVHVDPRRPFFVAPPEVGGNWGGEPFYVGKGCGQRAWDLKRNQGHGKRIKALLNEGFASEDIVRVVLSGMDEGTAFAAEAKLIYFFGSVYSVVKPTRRAVLLNLDVPKVPDFVGEMRKS